MSILTAVIPAAFGALDSNAFVDGDASDAHVLRSIVEGSNRLMARGEPICNFVWDASTDMGESDGRLLGWGWPFWFQITPGPITRPKMPGRERAKCFVRFNMRSGETAYIQVHTSALPFDPSRPSSAPNMITLSGTGADAWAELAGIPLDYGDVEYVAFWLRGVPTATNGSTATNGAPNTGTVTRIEAEGSVLVDATTPATWNTTGNTWRTGGHCVLVENAAAQQIAEPRWITGVPEATKLRVYPPYDPGVYGGAFLEGATYRIRELPQWRINNIALYASTRTA